MSNLLPVDGKSVNKKKTIRFHSRHSRTHTIERDSLPVDGGGRVLNEADHLLFDVHRLGLEGKGHFVDQ